MAVVGFNYTKIHVEKKQAAKGKINIKNNVALKDVKKSDLSLGGSDIKQAGLQFDFEFSAIYDPKIGEIRLNGEVLWIDSEDNVKAILKSWKADKKVPQEVSINVLNTVLQKCNIQALVMSRDINLPPPIQLPQVNPAKANEYIG